MGLTNKIVIIFSMFLSSLLFVKDCLAAPTITGIYSLWNSDATTTAWLDQRFKWRVGNSQPTATGITWMFYYDIYGPGSISELLELKAWSYSKSVIPENVLIHKA